VEYKESQNVSSTTPIRLKLACSIGWSRAETEMYFFKMVANFRDKMQAENRAFAIFLTPPYLLLPTTFKHPYGPKGEHNNL
jgi:hypothetical protein